MLNCKDMTKLISESLDRKISLFQRMELWMHIMMCSMCRRFRSNALALRRQIRAAKTPDEGSVSRSVGVHVTSPLPADAKQRIARVIEKELH